MKEGVIFWKWLNWMIARSVIEGAMRKERGWWVTFPIQAPRDIAQDILGRSGFGFVEYFAF